MTLSVTGIDGHITGELVSGVEGGGGAYKRQFSGLVSLDKGGRVVVLNQSCGS